MPIITVYLSDEEMRWLYDNKAKETTFTKFVRKMVQDRMKQEDVK